jgi:hypothetical protein
MFRKYLSKLVPLVCLLCLSGCAINLPFNNRLAYSHVSEAKRLTKNKTEPISIEWIPADFTNRIDVQGASGFVGGGSQTRIPTGVALSSRIMEALDVSIGIDPNSKNLLEMYILKAETKFEYSAGIANITPGIDYGWCNLEVEFNYNGTIWKESFVSEQKDTTIGGSSQTGIVEKAWDNVALEIAKSVITKIKHVPKNENYKDTEQYNLRKYEIAKKIEEEKVRAKAKEAEKSNYNRH